LDGLSGQSKAFTHAHEVYIYRLVMSTSHDRAACGWPFRALGTCVLSAQGSSLGSGRRAIDSPLGVGRIVER
jgi:hypothetical protein